MTKPNKMSELINKELGLFIYKHKLKLTDKEKNTLAMAMIAGGQLALSEMFNLVEDI